MPGLLGGGIVMNDDNDETRRAVEICYRTNKTLVNPIIDWTDEDVWEFIREYNVPYCKLYDEGWRRLGCVGCPMGGSDSMEREFERWPAIKNMYLRAFEDMIAKRKADGLRADIYSTPDEVMQWWLGKRMGFDEDQIKMEIEEMMGDEND